MSYLIIKNFGKERETNIVIERMISYLEDVAFAKEKEIAFPHKQAALMKVVREGWQAPEI